MWDVCLQLIDFAGSAVDGALVRQLWDHALLAAADHPESECGAAVWAGRDQHIYFQVLCMIWEKRLLLHRASAWLTMFVLD